jgi:tetratricopeptide (TPR) repeat protein
MSRRAWIVVAVIAAVVLTPVIADVGLHIVDPANAQPANDEPLPTDGPLTVLQKKAHIAERAKDYQRAVELYTEAIRLNDKVTTTYRERGSAYNYLERYKEAVADYDKALALGTSSEVPRETAMAHLGRGYALLLLDQNQPAVADFDAVLKVVPGSSNALRWRGAAYQGLGDRAKAVADYKAALAIEPKNQRILNSLKFLGEPLP